jgi:hypothetical protein
MNPEIQKQLVDIIAAARTAGADVADFISQQAPDVIHEYLLTRAVQSVFGIVALAGIACLFFYFAKLAKKHDNIHNDVWPSCVPRNIGVMLLFLSLLPFYSLLKVILAPKLVVLEWIIETIHTHHI